MNVEQNNAYRFKLFHAVCASSFTALAEDTSTTFFRFILALNIQLRRRFDFHFHLLFAILF